MPDVRRLLAMMRKRKNPHAAAMGRKGGRAKVAKGFALWTPEQWAAWREKRTADAPLCPCGCGLFMSVARQRHPKRIKLLAAHVGPNPGR